MIKPGTICLLVRDHEFAGRVCTVLSSMRPGCVLVANGVELPRDVEAYLIDVHGAPKPKPDTRYTLCLGWGALRSQLLPITPPGMPEQIDLATPRKVPEAVT